MSAVCDVEGVDGGEECAGGYCRASLETTVRSSAAWGTARVHGVHQRDDVVMLGGGEGRLWGGVHRLRTAYGLCVSEGRRVEGVRRQGRLRCVRRLWDGGLWRFVGWGRCCAVLRRWETAFVLMRCVGGTACVSMRCVD